MLPRNQRAAVLRAHLAVTLFQQLLHCGHGVRVEMRSLLGVEGHADLARLGVDAEGGLHRALGCQLWGGGTGKC